jgi:hypothetical protein
MVSNLHIRICTITPSSTQVKLFGNVSKLLVKAVTKIIIYFVKYAAEFVPLDHFSKPAGQSRGLYYTTFYDRNLRIFIIS